MQAKIQALRANHQYRFRGYIRKDEAGVGVGCFGGFQGTAHGGICGIGHEISAISANTACLVGGNGREEEVIQLIITSGINLIYRNYQVLSVVISKGSIHLKHHPAGSGGDIDIAAIYFGKLV